MDRTKARRFINKAYGDEKISSGNSNYANINKGKRVWWINPDQGRFSEDYFLLLNNGKQLIVLFIPNNTFTDLDRDFRIRKDNGRVDLEISCDKEFKYLEDIKSGARGIDFKPFIFDSLDLPDELKENHIRLKNKDRGGATERNKTKRETELKPGQRILKEGEKNISYQNLFADYLKGANKITIQDPYIRYSHQFKNLLEFCVMLGKNKEPREEINLEIIAWNEDAFQSQSRGYFDEVLDSVSDLKINLSYKLEEHHDRYIKADNGWKIILGRGLDIYQKPAGRFTIADIDQAQRKCRACEITYIKESNS